MLQRTISRREALTGLAVAAAIMPRRTMAAETELTFGLTPVMLTNDLDLLHDLEDYLEKRLRHRIRLVLRRTYQEITALLLSGQLTAAWICGYPFVVHRDSLSLIGVPVWHGEPLYQSYVIAAKDSPAESVWDLEGNIHAFSDPDSNSGHLVTWDLLVQRGRRPESFFSRTFYTYGHRNVVRAVASGLAQSGSVDGYVWDVLQQLEPGLTGATKVVRRSEWLGFPPVAAASAFLDTSAVEGLKSALLTMHEDQTGSRVLGMLRLDRFSEEKPTLFDPIAEKVLRVQKSG
jgi:phosphonate transport system substrate-binding protein